MARDLQQLDLFGNERSSPVPIAARKSIKSNKHANSVVKQAVAPAYAAAILTQVAEDDLPLVSRSAQHLNTTNTIQKGDVNHLHPWMQKWVK